MALFAYAGIAFLQGETDLAMLAACLTGASRRLSLVQLPSGRGVHGRHRLPGARRRAGRHGDRHQHGDPASAHRRALFVVEALSVIIQVFSFRVFHRRVFLMAPIHHHFELKGWSETKIIVRFWISRRDPGGGGLRPLLPQQHPSPGGMSVGREGELSPVAGTGGSGLPATVRRVLVLGASRSGASAAAALAGLGLEVTLSDRRGPESLPGLGAALGVGVRFVTEESLEECWPLPDLVVKSPGVPGEAKPVRMARRSADVPVWSELELAYALFPNPFDAITGTNGKTTTTALLGHLFATAGRPARVLGNIGVAVTSVAGELEPDEELVVEVSSFQLEDIHAFRPAVGVFLNLTPDHLDRHGTMERYLACKANLFANQRAGDVAVLNLADPAVAALGIELARETGRPAGGVLLGRGSRRRRWSRRTRRIGNRPGTDYAALLRPDSWVEEGWIFLEREPVVRVSDIRLPGWHNLENCLAAGTAAMARGVDPRGSGGGSAHLRRGRSPPGEGRNGRRA